LVLHVTDDTLKSLENVFSLDVSSSDSSIELITVLDNEVLKPLGSGTLYTVLTSLEGEVEGQVLVLMRASDFGYLSRLMKPVLDTYFDGDPDTGDASPSAGGNAPVPIAGGKDASRSAQMLELLAELGNILCGVYSRAIFKACALNSHHCLPSVTMDKQQLALQKLFAEPGAGLQPLLVLENEYFVLDNPVRFWCLISPTKASFMKMLLRLEENGEDAPAAYQFAQYAPTTKH